MSVRSKSTINDRITSINRRQSLQDQKLCRSEANQLLMIVLLLSTKDNNYRIKSYVGQKGSKSYYFYQPKTITAGSKVMSVRSKSTINDRITSINQRKSLQDQKLCLSETNQLLMIVLLLSTKDNHCRIKSYVGQKQINY